MRSLFQSDTVKLVVGLLIGLAAIMYFNPPHTICDSKKDAYLESIKPLSKSYGKNLKLCKEHTEPGGCLPFFETVGKLLTTLNDVGAQCRAVLSDENLTQGWITSSMEMMVRAAWGTKAPVSYQYRQGWLDMNQAATFCRLKKNMVEIYEEQAWLQFVDYLLNDLPGAQAIGRNEAWARSLLSDSCKY